MMSADKPARPSTKGNRAVTIRSGNPIVREVARQIAGVSGPRTGFRSGKPAAATVAGRVLGRAPTEERAAIFVHGSLASGGMWKGYARAFEQDFAVSTPDLVGYGRNPAWPEGLAFRLRDEVSDFAGRIDGVAEPFDIVAHSYGGLVALRFAWENPDRVRSLTLIEPTVFRVLADPDFGAPAECAEIATVADGVREGVLLGEPDKAMHGFVDYWNGKGAWNMLPDDLRQRFAAQAATVARNFEVGAGDDMPLEDLRDLDIPTLLISGSRSTGAARTTTRIVGDLLPRVETVEIEGAGHMSPVTHPQAVMRLVDNWLREGRVDRQAAA